MFGNLDQQLEATTGSLDALAKVLPTGLIQEALDAGERSDRRIRKLPLRVVMWLVVGMSLYRDLNIQNVPRLLDQIPTGSLLLADRLYYSFASLVPGLYEAMLDALAACELPPGRKGRTCPREVKTKKSNYKKKRTKAA